MRQPRPWSPQGRGPAFPGSGPRKPRCCRARSGRPARGRSPHRRARHGLSGHSSTSGPADRPRSEACGTGPRVWTIPARTIRCVRLRQAGFRRKKRRLFQHAAHPQVGELDRGGQGAVDDAFVQQGFAAADRGGTMGLRSRSSSPARSVTSATTQVRDCLTSPSRWIWWSERRKNWPPSTSALRAGVPDGMGAMSAEARSSAGVGDWASAGKAAKSATLRANGRIGKPGMNLRQASGGRGGCNGFRHHAQGLPPGPRLV